MMKRLAGSMSPVDLPLELLVGQAKLGEMAFSRPLERDEAERLFVHRAGEAIALLARELGAARFTQSKE